ncbi:MAG: OmpA family protein [Saprospiraceae bacterium]|nr:OmpA family protein [Saprospiraceae bacterium]
MKIKIFICCVLSFIAFSLISQSDTSKVAISRFDKVRTDQKVNKIHIDSRNLMWLATDKGVIKSSGDGSTFQEYLSGKNIADIVTDSKNRVWAGSKNTIFNVETGTSYLLPQADAEIRDIEFFDSQVFAGTNKGLFVLNVTSGKFKTQNSSNSKLPDNNINFLHGDKNKILWIGTDAGYVRVDGEKWEVQDKKYKMLATTENSEGQWIISDKDMFLVNKFNRLFPVKLDPQQYRGKINEFVIDSKGRIYIASDILVRYDPYTETIENYTADAGSLSKSAISLACDKNDNIWIGTNGAGYYKLLFGDIAKEQLNAVIIIERSVSCYNGNNGALKVSVSGGTRPFTYKWNKSNIQGASVNGLSAGVYEVTVTDKFETMTVTSVELVNPEPIKIDVVSNNRVTTPDSPDGSVEIKVSGGKGNYTYLWSNGQKNQNLTKVSSGTYNLNVKDDGGCEASLSVNVKREKFIPDLEASKIALGQKLRINELNFDADSSIITQNSFDVLEEVFEFLNANKAVKVEIGGHTNTIPPHEYCDKLSTERARNVAEFLYSRGIDPSRVSYKGYGKREPLTDSTTRQGRQRNQRVEIKILSI